MATAPLHCSNSSGARGSRRAALSPSRIAGVLLASAGGILCHLALAVRWGRLFHFWPGMPGVCDSTTRPTPTHLPTHTHTHGHTHTQLLQMHSFSLFLWVTAASVGIVWHVTSAQWLSTEGGIMRAYNYTAISLSLLLSLSHPVCTVPTGMGTARCLSCERDTLCPALAGGWSVKWVFRKTLWRCLWVWHLLRPLVEIVRREDKWELLESLTPEQTGPPRLPSVDQQVLLSTA